MDTLLKKIKIYGIQNSILTSTQLLYNFVHFRLLQGSYSQHGEDLVIDKLLGHKRKGTYVDVGAYDPVKVSNTNRFYLRGWKGVNIEPNYIKYQKFVVARKRDNNVNCGIGTEEKNMSLYMFELDSLATFSKKEAREYVAGGFSVVKQQSIPIKKLATILKSTLKKEPLDFISIDTQGTELEVLKSNDWRRYRPKVICIETFKSPGIPTDESKRIHTYLINKGYKKYNDVYLNSNFYDPKTIQI